MLAGGAGDHPSDSAAPLQPEEGEDDVGDWLDEPEHLAQAERVDRLAADLDLVNTLGLADFRASTRSTSRPSWPSTDWPSFEPGYVVG